MSWDLDGGSGKQEFTKFPVGVTRIRILSEAPHARWTHWMNQYGRSVTCPGNCAIDVIRKEQKANDLPYTYNMAQSFSMNVFNHELNRYEIMEQSKTFMTDLRDVMEDLKADGKVLSDVILKVRRRGTGTDTTYRIDVDETAEMSSAERRASEGAKNLREYFMPHTHQQIFDLVNATFSTPAEYKEYWNSVMETSAEPTQDEAIEVEGA